MRPVNCDQVAWMLAAIRRYLPSEDAPSVSRARGMKAYGLLYELMEVAGLCFEDDQSAHNGTPPDVSMLREKGAGVPRSEQEQMPDGLVDRYRAGGVIGESACEGLTLSGGRNAAKELGALAQQQYQSRLTPAPD